MNKFFFTILIISFNVLACSSSNTGELPELPEEPVETNVLFGDPFILLHGDTYYAYGTYAEDGIAVYVSQDLLTWNDVPDNRLALDKKDSWGERWFWAPEVYHVDGKFYMYYSADEHICVATSDSPLGPFKQTVKKPMLEGEKCIDNSLFIDDDGKPYLFFDRFNDGLNIWVAELEADLMTMRVETMTKCINVSQPWEKVWPRVNEGPFVLKHKGKYYMTYSANSYESPFYGIGYATADDVTGPWTKYEGNPILQKPGELVGVGHSAMFTDKKGQLRIVFHSHQSATAIHPRYMNISTVNFITKDGEVVMQVDNNYVTPKRQPTAGNDIAGGIRIEWDQRTLQRLAPQDGRQLRYAGYPRIKRLSDGTVIAVYEAQGNTELIWSDDSGKTWSEPIITFHGHSHADAHGNEVRVNMANPEFIELKNGDWLAACNYRPTKPEVAPFAIAIARSNDRGKTWHKPQVIYEAEPRFRDGCWEPAFLQLPNGTLQVYFANEQPYTATDEQEISMLASLDNGYTWSSDARTVSFRAGRRDGMPVPLVVGDEILVAIEDNKVGQFKPYIVRTSIVDNWEVPVDAGSPMREYALRDPLPDEVYAGAPYLARLATGEVLLAYQTTKGRSTDWEKSTMEVAIGDKEGRNFRKISRPFPVPPNREAKWNAIALWDENTVVATSATNFDGGTINAWMILGRIMRN